MKRKAILLLGVPVAVLIAVAADYGKWMCSNCAAPMSPIEARAFIGSNINKHVPAWIGKDTVSICNGTACTRYQTPYGGNVGTIWSPIETTPDTGGPYRGSGLSMTGIKTDSGADLAGYDWGALWDFILGGSWQIASIEPNGYVVVEPIYCTGNPSYDALIGACP